MKKKSFIIGTLSVLFCLVIVRPSHAGSWEEYFISSYIDSQTLLMDKGSKSYITTFSSGCHFSKQDVGRDMYLDEQGSPATNNDAFYFDTTGKWQFCTVTNTPKYLYLYTQRLVKKNPKKKEFIVQTKNKEKYRIHHGSACSKVKLRVPSNIYIDSKNTTLDKSDSIYIFKSSGGYQKCSISKIKQIPKKIKKKQLKFDIIATYPDGVMVSPDLLDSLTDYEFEVYEIIGDTKQYSHSVTSPLYMFAIENMKANTQYKLRMRGITQQGTKTVWSNWKTITTLAESAW